MNCTSKKLGLGFGVLLVMFAVDGVSNAQPSLPTMPQTVAIPTCGSATAAARATANATLTVTTTTAGESTSPDGSYVGTGCGRYIVDVKFSAFVTGYGTQTDAKIVEPLDTQAECEAAQITVFHFRKAAGATAFTPAGGGTMRGTWSAPTPNSFGGGCNMTPTKGFTPKGSPANGEMWRVAVGGVIRSIPVKVKVSANMPAIPQ